MLWRRALDAMSDSARKQRLLDEIAGYKLDASDEERLLLVAQHREMLLDRAGARMAHAEIVSRHPGSSEAVLSRIWISNDLEGERRELELTLPVRDQQE
jgi:hypothetical protein